MKTQKEFFPCVLQKQAPWQSFCTVAAVSMIVFLLTFASSASAQSASNQSDGPRVFTLNMGTADSKFHADVVQLLELTGAREKLEARKKAMVEEGRKKLMEQCPQCRPEFVNEWAKRMLQRFNPDDFINVYVSVYEKYLTREDVTELISIQKKLNAHQQAEATPGLREKLRSVMPSMMGDIMGGCAKLGAELGGKVGAEIGEEHPEYLKKAGVASHH